MEQGTGNHRKAATLRQRLWVVSEAFAHGGESVYDAWQFAGMATGPGGLSQTKQGWRWLQEWDS